MWVFFWGKMFLRPQVRIKDGKEHTYRSVVENQRLHDGRVVALSSVWPEPIASIGLEVRRYALPVVAFDAGGIKGWLLDGHNGYLVPWMDREQFATRLKQLLTDKPLAQKFGENGLKLVSERYDFAQYIRVHPRLGSHVPARHCGAKGRPRQAVNHTSTRSVNVFCACQSELQMAGQLERNWRNR